MRKTVFLVVTLLAVLFLNSCKRDIEVPAYLYITSPQFVTKSGEGTNLQVITHVGIYINDNLQGIYQIPGTIPVLSKGNNMRVEIRPFIRRLARDGYVNYTMASSFIDSTVSLLEGKTDTVRPVFGYQSNVEFEWLDDFNNGTKTFVIDTSQSSIDTIYVTKNQGVGVDTTQYAFIDMGTAADPFFRIETQDAYQLPFDGRDVFIEFHYKSNVPFTLGLTEVYNGSEIDLPSVSPYETSGEWRKGYVYLNDELINAPTSAKYRVFIRTANGDESIHAKLYFDNFKLMYRE